MFTNKRKIIIYIAGKYSDKTPEKVTANILLAKKCALDIWRMGYTAICPHLNTEHFDDELDLVWKDYLEGDIEIVSRCDGVFLLPNWKYSKGAVVENEVAKRLHKPTFKNLEELENYDWDYRIWTNKHEVN